MSAPIETWRQNDGELEAAIEALGKAKQPGVLLTLEADHRSLEKARKKGLRDQEARLLRKAWKIAIAAVGPAAVGKRTSWAKFGFAVAGTRPELESAATLLVGMLLSDDELQELAWHAVLIEVVANEPERTLRCDPGHDLAKAQGKSAVAYVQPYAGADWRESRRYPTVSLALVEGA